MDLIRTTNIVVVLRVVIVTYVPTSHKWFFHSEKVWVAVCFVAVAYVVYDSTENMHLREPLDKLLIVITAVKHCWLVWPANGKMSYLSKYRRSFHCGNRCDEGNTRRRCWHIRRGKLKPPEQQISRIVKETRQHFDHTSLLCTTLCTTPLLIPVIHYVNQYRCCRRDYICSKSYLMLINYLVQCTNATYYYRHLRLCRLRGLFAQNI